MFIVNGIRIECLEMLHPKNALIRTFLAFCRITIDGGAA